MSTNEKEILRGIMRDLDIELCGINNLYYRMVDELERAEKIGRSANF